MNVTLSFIIFSINPTDYSTESGVEILSLFSGSQAKDLHDSIAHSQYTFVGLAQITW